jgi:hypothetical protein
VSWLFRERQREIERFTLLPDRARKFLTRTILMPSYSPLRRKSSSSVAMVSDPLSTFSRIFGSIMNSTGSNRRLGVPEWVTPHLEVLLEYPECFVKDRLRESNLHFFLQRHGKKLCRFAAKPIGDTY